MQDKQKDTQKKQKYSAFEKKQILDKLIVNPSLNQFKSISEKYNITVRTLRKWFNKQFNKTVLEWRKRINPESITELEKWILSKTREKVRKVNREEIKQKAQEIINQESFIASRGWIKQFMDNNDIDYKIKEILFENGILSEQQAQKFQQEKTKRRELNGHDNQETVSKQESLEQKEKIQTSEFNKIDNNQDNYLDDNQDDYQENNLGYLEYQDFLVDYEDSRKYL